MVLCPNLRSIVTFLLINGRFLKVHFAAGNADMQIAFSVCADFIGPFDPERDSSWIPIRRYDKITFESLLVSIKDEINTWIDVSVPDPCIRRDAGPPLTAVVTQKVVALTRLLVESHNSLWLLAVLELYPQHGRTGGLLALPGMQKTRPLGPGAKLGC
jgi:hypothetical protein